LPFGDAVTIIAVTYNSSRHLRPFLESVRSQTYPNCELLIVDNASTDNTIEILQSEARWARLIPQRENLGYRRANSLGFERCSTPLMLICNDDVILEPDCVAELVRSMTEKPKAAMICPLITLYDQPQTVNTVGNRLSITGFYSARGKGRIAAEFSESSQLISVSGCCFLYRRDVYLELGGFSADFDGFPSAWHASYEDVDLSYRARCAGYEILFQPSAVLRHRYIQKPMRPTRFSSMMFGRALLVLRNFEISTILRLAPLFAFCEIALLGYALLKGPLFLAEMLRLWIWLTTHPRRLIRMRRSVQSKRRVRDRELLPLLDAMFEVAPQVDRNPLTQRGAAVIDWICRTYQALILPASPSAERGWRAA